MHVETNRSSTRPSIIYVSFRKIVNHDTIARLDKSECTLSTLLFLSQNCSRSLVNFEAFENLIYIPFAIVPSRPLHCLRYLSIYWLQIDFHSLRSRDCSSESIFFLVAILHPLVLESPYNITPFSSKKKFYHAV